MIEKAECIDCGTEYCPCKLAENGECIVCSQLQGSKFCDCINWQGVCIYQELINNGKKAKNPRKTIKCNVLDIQRFKDNLIILTLEVPHRLAVNLVRPGSYIFIKEEEEKYFDVPISIMESDVVKNTISLAIEVRGVKTKRFKEVKIGESVSIRGPYWNGIFGLTELNNRVNDNILILARGIGMAPMLPVLRRVINNDNNIEIFLDKNPFEEIFIESYLKKYDVKITETNLINKGTLSEEGRFIIENSIKDKNINMIHLAGPDILTYSVIKYLDEIGNNKIPLSCCNNFKLCCGEGICGACTTRFSGRRIKRFCKLQTDPRSIFEGRRLI